MLMKEKNLEPRWSKPHRGQGIFAVIALGLMIGLVAPSSHALTYLGTDLTAPMGGNDKIDAVVAFLESLGLPSDIALLGKSGEGPELSDFSPALSSLHGGTTGTINYTGSEDITYITFKAAARYHLYEFMNDDFDIEADSGFKNGISHISVWTSPLSRVPESGATALFLILSGVCLGVCKSKQRYTA